jgi:hypothetical protein
MLHLLIIFFFINALQCKVLKNGMRRKKKVVYFFTSFYSKGGISGNSSSRLLLELEIQL